MCGCARSRLIGPGDHPRGLISYVTQSLLRGERPALTTGEPVWDYLYVADAARAVALLASHPEAGGIYNLASGTARTIRSLVERLRDQINPDLALGFGEIPYHADQIMSLRADISRLQRLTDWFPRCLWRRDYSALSKEYQSEEYQSEEYQSEEYQSEEYQRKTSPA